MDRKQKIQEIRASEKEFLQRVQELIETKHKPYLFEKYNETIATVAECYKDPQSSFAQKQACAEAATQKYLYKEKRFEELMKYYQTSISECIQLTAYDLSNPVLDGYLQCFKKIKDLLR